MIESDKSLSNGYWKDIPGYEGIYQASQDGNILSVKRHNVRKDGVEQTIGGRILSPALNASGYYCVNLKKNGKGKTFLVSRLIALTFIENPLNLPEVNHKNELKTDNRVENLEWVSHIDNCNFGTRNIRHSIYMKGRYMGKDHAHPQPVICITTGRKFESIADATRTYNLKSASSISACCKGINSYGGTLPDGTKLEWKYDNKK